MNDNNQRPRHERRSVEKRTTRQGCGAFQLKIPALDVNVGQDTQRRLANNAAYLIWIFIVPSTAKAAVALLVENSIKLYLKPISAHPPPPVLNFITLKYRRAKSYHRWKSASLPPRRSLKASLRKVLSINRHYLFLSSFLPRLTFNMVNKKWFLSLIIKISIESCSCYYCWSLSS